VWVCLCIIALKEKWLALSSPNLVHIYSMAVTQHALTRRSKDQGHIVMKTVTVAWLLVKCCCGYVLLMPAWDCTSYDCLGFWYYCDYDGAAVVTDSRPSLHRVPSDYDFPPPPVSQSHRTHRPARRYPLPSVPSSSMSISIYILKTVFKYHVELEFLNSI